MEEEPNNFFALKVDIAKYFTNHFFNKQQPLKYTITKKRQYRQEIFMLVIAKQGLAFNIPIYYPSFFNLLYSFIKLIIKQATTKIKNKNSVPLVLTPKRLNLPIPLRKPVNLLSHFPNTPMLGLNNINYSPTSPTLELSTPIRH